MAADLRDIDALILEHGLLGRTCRTRGDGSTRRVGCECGHIRDLHIGGSGRCTGRRCGCQAFDPYRYEKETEARLAKFRRFALAVLALEGGRPGGRS